MIDHLDEATIRLNLKGRTKEDVLSELVGVLVENGIIAGSQPMLSSLLEREALGSTGIGFGVAIPHGRSAEASRPAVVLGRADEAVEFGSIDGKPARLFFLLVAPENGDDEHLHLLASIARVMKDAPVREALLQLNTPREILALLQKKDTP